MSAHKWQFSSRFKRNAFGWRSQVPITRIKEALSEIRSLARRDPTLAADGAVLFLEKISPALTHVDGSSGALGNAVNKAIEVLVPIICNPSVSDIERQKWLARLWIAYEKDNMPYIELLGEYWGQLCVTPELASFWADQFIDVVKRIWSPKVTGHNFYKGTTPCLSALFTAGRYQEILELLDGAPFKWWHDRYWGVKALVALERAEEALKYAEDSKGLNSPVMEICKECEAILLSRGLTDEAYERYALIANQTTTNLATFRAIVKKYPNKDPIDILNDLIDSQPGAEGKWFAAAKSAGFYDLAIQLVSEYPADPRTLARAAKEFAEKNSVFAIASGIASLHWILEGYGYEISSADVLSAYSSIMKAAKASGSSQAGIKKKILELLESGKPHSQFVQDVLINHLSRAD